jgi:uncharacterized protein (TIGR02001 family)
MRKTVLASAVAAAFAIPAAAIAADAPPASPHTIAYNVGVVSDYLFRGVSQTHGKPALQGGIDYSHSSGLYLGVAGSTITWVKDWLGKGTAEVDLYGGYKNTFAGGDWNYDLGLITYQYPGKGSAIKGLLADPTTTELYGALGYKWLTAKYSYAISKNFIGWYGGPSLDKDTRGSNYLELNAAYDVGNGWGVSAHVGQQKVKNSVDIPTLRSANYKDWNIGVTKDVGFGVVGLTYSDTDSSGSCNSAGGTNSYCWPNGSFVAGVGPSTGFRDVSKGILLVSFKKTF